jgi:hypothetical protein
LGIASNHHNNNFNNILGNSGSHLNQVNHLHNEFEDNLLMDELDIDELIDCDDIESTVFISSSK